MFHSVQLRYHSACSWSYSKYSFEFQGHIGGRNNAHRGLTLFGVYDYDTSSALQHHHALFERHGGNTGE